MKKYCVEIMENRLKKVTMYAESASDALSIAALMDDDEVDSSEVTGGRAIVFLVDSSEPEGEDEDDDCDDSFDGFDDCDDCPDYCEVCGSCAKEADFVPNRGQCANCEFRCSACKACTLDE